MADTKYTPITPPLTEDIKEIKRYLTAELRKLSAAVEALNERLKALEP